jgi:hypothetical protein
MAGAFQSDAFQNDAFQTGAVAPVVPDVRADLTISDAARGSVSTATSLTSTGVAVSNSALAEVSVTDD